MAALITGNACKKLSDCNSGQETSGASLRQLPWQPGGLHLRRHGLQSESLQYLQLATHYHS